MDTTGNVGQPSGSTPPSGPPASPPSGPPSGPPSSPPPDPPAGSPSQPPPLPPLPHPGGVLEIAVKRRMLWIGSAALPLHNLTRVEAIKIKPERNVLRFLLGLALVAVLYSVTDWTPVFVLLIVLVVYFVKALLTPATPALIVETAGGSRNLVTLPSVDELRTIAGQIVHAIDHPEAEFTAYVHQLNNYNGPVFNQNGAQNTGIRL
ncbi:DUF6232 family protein [Streptomyces sp. CS057]|uniref:DUF6232 family protein n=1 Tax=Streptomyces sp. CS057 TaxID=1982764 RepID=UPI00211AB9D6|nr:DUF6232 family protein [Streptomyces sp. CS057]